MAKKILIIDEINKTVTNFPVEFGFAAFLISGNSPNTVSPYSDIIVVTNYDYDHSAKNRLVDLQEVWGSYTRFYVFTQSIVTEQAFFTCKNFDVRLYSKTSVGTQKMYRDLKTQIDNLKGNLYEKSYE